MSRWLYQFVVVAPSCADELLYIATKSQEHIWEDSSGANYRYVFVLETVVHQLLQSDPNRIVFYRMFIDGWSAPHQAIEDQLDKYDPAKQLWQRFCDCSVLINATEESHNVISHLVSQIKELRVKAWHGDVSEPGAIGGELFTRCLEQWLIFCNCTHCPGIITTRCLGMTYDDDEFQDL